MSPIDDELRSLFTSRADLLAPAPDPLAGIESRARRMRRNRVAASVAGTALAVAAIAAVVPAVLPEKVADGGGSQFADVTPTPTASAPDRAFAPQSLDPANPWPFRGTESVLIDGGQQSLTDQWRAKHAGSSLTPLYGQVYEPSNAGEVVFVASGPDGDRWAVATTSESGWQILVDNALAPDTKALLAALPGDEVPRLLVLTSPAIGDIAYAPDGTTFRSYEGSDGGVSVVPLEGDTSRDAVRVLDGNGDLDKPVFLGPAPDFVAGSGAAAAPNNLVTWPSRGATPDAAFLEKALNAFAQGLGAKRSDVEGKVLFAGDDDARNVFVFGQAWIKGSDAHTFGYSVNGKGEATPFLGPITAKNPDVLAFVVAAGTGQSTETLVVVPDPAVAKVLYGVAASEYDVKGAGQENLNGVVLIDRDPRAQGDKLKLLDGSEKVLFEGEVASLLCGIKECG